MEKNINKTKIMSGEHKKKEKMSDTFGLDHSDKKPAL